MDERRNEFLYCFQISRTIIFEVDYYTLSTNPNPHFSTSAYEFIRSKMDFGRGGQAQEHLLVGRNAALAREFFEKWDKCHLKNLSDTEYAEVVKDIECLKRNYNHIEKLGYQGDFRETYTHISFRDEKELSMQPVKICQDDHLNTVEWALEEDLEEEMEV